MLGKLFLLFTGVTALELFLLIQLGNWMGLWWTLGLIFATGALGAWLAKREGIRVLSRIRSDLSRQRVPADAGLDGLLVLLAGAFLITPGVLTDAVGFALLLAPVRAPIKRRLRERFSRWAAEGRVRVTRHAGPFGPPRRARQGEVIDVRTEEPEEPAESDPRSGT